MREILNGFNGFLILTFCKSVMYGGTMIRIYNNPDEASRILTPAR
jgi:hypothetical protein